MNSPSATNTIVNQASWFTLFSLLSATVVAQGCFSVQGQVVDATTNKPVPFATLSVAGGLSSSETNSEGYFMLSLPKQTEMDTLRLIAAHYSLALVPLSSLPAVGALIRLNGRPDRAYAPATTAYFSLDPPFHTRDTLLKAVASIAKNYTHKPTRLHEFYREIIQEQPTNLCVSYTEGLIDIYKPSYYFPKKEDQIHFIKGRRKPVSTFSIPF